MHVQLSTEGETLSWKTSHPRQMRVKGGIHPGAEALLYPGRRYRGEGRGTKVLFGSPSHQPSEITRPQVFGSTSPDSRTRLKLRIAIQGASFFPKRTITLQGNPCSRSQTRPGPDLVVGSVLLILLEEPNPATTLLLS